MSHFEGRAELCAAAGRAIESNAAALERLSAELAGADMTGRLNALATFMQASGFSVELAAGGVDGAFIARRERLNAEDMRKGLRHGNVAFITAASAPDEADGIGWAASDMVAAAAAALGLAATLARTIHGTSTLIAVPNVSDVSRLVEAGVFEEPDCVMLMRARAAGHAFQHTIDSSGRHLAQTSVSVKLPDGEGQFLHELQAAVRSIIDELEAPDSIEPAADGFVIRARSAATISETAGRIAALARARAESTGVEVQVERADVAPEFLPSRILARRVKTFADTFKFGHDGVQKEPVAAPTAWGAISQVSATAQVRYPAGGGETVSADDLRAVRNAATAAACAGLDVLGDMEFRGFVEGEMIRGLRQRGITRTPRRWLGVHPVIPRADYTPARSDFPDVVVRGPGLPDPLSRNRPEEDES